VKAGDLVAWKHRFESGIPSELGIIMDHVIVPGDPWPYWLVAFGSRGALKCRESDLQVVSEAR
jgi:hypothetical protein